MGASGEQAEPCAGGGVLVLVAGPSGAGKDTLISAARAHFTGDPRFVFPRRVVTRPSDVSEQVRQVSPAEFEALEGAGGFFLAWRAHGLAYGIPVEARRRLEDGRTVVVNVSRRIIGAAFEVWPHSHAVYIHVAHDVLRSRLQSRGRETAGQIGARMSRAAASSIPLPGDTPEGATVIDNSGPLGESTRELISTLENQAARAQRAISRKGVA